MPGRSTWVSAAQSKVSRRQQQQRAAQHAAKAAWHPLSFFFLSCSTTYTEGSPGPGERETQSGGYQQQLPTLVALSTLSGEKCWLSLCLSRWLAPPGREPRPPGSLLRPRPSVWGRVSWRCEWRWHLLSSCQTSFLLPPLPQAEHENPSLHLNCSSSEPVCSEPRPAAWWGTGWKLYTLSHLILTTALCYYHQLILSNTVSKSGTGRTPLKENCGGEYEQLRLRCS